MTNTDTAHLAMILHSGFEIVSNQICFSLLDQRARNNGMLDLCAQHGVTVLAFGTLAGGFLTERWLAQPEPDWDALETWSQMKYGRFIREAGGRELPVHFGIALYTTLPAARLVATPAGLAVVNTRRDRRRGHRSDAHLHGDRRGGCACGRPSGAGRCRARHVVCLT